jgi:hypothetical protein
MRKLLLILAASGLALVGCGEGDQQVVNYKQGKYQGKPDSLPWNSEPPAAELRGGNWTKGDRASWEDQIRRRQLAQHEHIRIYQ